MAFTHASNMAESREILCIDIPGSGGNSPFFRGYPVLQWGAEHVNTILKGAKVNKTTNLIRIWSKIGCNSPVFRTVTPRATIFGFPTITTVQLIWRRQRSLAIQWSLS